MLGRLRSLRGRVRFAPAALVGTIAVSTAVLGIAVPLAAPAGAAQVPQRIGPETVLPDGAVAMGALSASSVLHVDVVLQPRDPAALAAFASAVSTPGSTLYRHYLPAGAFPGRFGPLPATIAKVDSWLRSQGLHPGALSGNHLSIAVTATAGQLEHALSIRLERYQLPSRVAFANIQAPLFGGAVASAVQGVIGLNTVATPVRENLTPTPRRAVAASSPHVATGGPQPCSAAKSAGSAYGSFTADQLASAYKFSSLYGAGDLGAGQTVALFELEPNLTTDISAYQSCYGTSATVTYTKEDGGSGSGAGEGEAALDIEDIVGLAPKVSVDVYQGPNSNTGLYDTYSGIVTQDKAKVVSTSWGECESEAGSVLAEENTLFEQASTQGQSIFAAAGDGGSEDCGKSSLAVDDPASQPYVTGVGGTKITALGPPPTQTVWNENLIGGGAGGGGISLHWTMPTYQSGAPSSLHVINSDSSATPCKAASGSYCREVPDVSADADPYSGYVIYYSGSWTAIGGTSAAAPLWAAFMALTNASSGCGGTPIGFANPALYKVAGSSSYATSFSDITSGNNDYTGTNSGKFPAGTGYDMASGLGTPIGSGLPAALCKGGSTGGNTVTVTNPGNKTSTVGAKVSLQIKAKDSAGAALTYTSKGLPAGLSLNHKTGLISGTIKNPGKNTVTVTATDTTGASGNTTFTWTHTAT